jgi:hypothetical protein
MHKRAFSVSLSFHHKFTAKTEVGKETFEFNIKKDGIVYRTRAIKPPLYYKPLLNTNHT